MGDFSALRREEYLDTLQSETFDLLVIGGGITGAGIALDATARGLKVALVEKKDFAWGTSSRSTKLIHGGLRYLKQFEIQLVQEVGRERAIVYNNARHIVRPEKMLLPIVEGGSLGKTMSSLGLWVYDYLAGVEKDERRKMLNASKTLGLEPLLRKDIVKGGGLYYEYRSDDARLTIENIKTAVAKGATCINYVQVNDFILDGNGQVTGANCTDNIDGKELSIQAKIIVNATGPWVDTLRETDRDGVKGKRLHLTKGVHIVVDRKKLPLQQSTYFDVDSDGRMVFAIPRGKVTYIGTTDTTYKTSIDNPTASIEDVEYILGATNAMFPDVNLKVEDVESTWSGLRPLIHEDGKDPSELSRKDEIFYSTSGLISIAGGKLTGYRKMAERIVDKVIKKMKDDFNIPSNQFSSCTTKDIKLSGGDFNSEKELNDFIVDKIGECKQVLVPQDVVIDWVMKYGRETEKIIERVFEIYNKVSDAEERILQAELWYSIQFEMSNNISDYLIRRTGRLYFERKMLNSAYKILQKYVTIWLEKSEIQAEKELKEFERDYKEVISFKNEVVKF